jgi:hypothetical protein
MSRPAKIDTPLFIKQRSGSRLRERLEAQLDREKLKNVTDLARIVLERWVEEREIEQQAAQQPLSFNQRSV